MQSTEQHRPHMREGHVVCVRSDFAAAEVSNTTGKASSLHGFSALWLGGEGHGCREGWPPILFLAIAALSGMARNGIGLRSGGFEGSRCAKCRGRGGSGVWDCMLLSGSDTDLPAAHPGTLCERLEAALRSTALHSKREMKCQTDCMCEHVQTFCHRWSREKLRQIKCQLTANKRFLTITVNLARVFRLKSALIRENRPAPKCGHGVTMQQQHPHASGTHATRAIRTCNASDSPTVAFALTL
jgi:hypothetical protein